MSSVCILGGWGRTGGPGLVKLDLNGNQLHDVTLQLLCAHGPWPALRLLSLAKNLLGGSGTLRLATALYETFPALESLLLDGNQLDENDGAELARAMGLAGAAPALRMLDVRWQAGATGIGAEAAIALREAAQADYRTGLVVSV